MSKQYVVVVTVEANDPQSAIYAVMKKVFNSPEELKAVELEQSDFTQHLIPDQAISEDGEPWECSIPERCSYQELEAIYPADYNWDEHPF